MHLLNKQVLYKISTKKCKEYDMCKQKVYNTMNINEPKI
jgi:hypothetical protein